MAQEKPSSYQVLKAENAALRKALAEGTGAETLASAFLKALGGYRPEPVKKVSATATAKAVKDHIFRGDDGLVAKDAANDADVTKQILANPPPLSRESIAKTRAEIDELKRQGKW